MHTESSAIPCSATDEPHVDPLRLPLLELIAADGLPKTDARDCPYLPGRLSRCDGFSAASLHGRTYQELMDLGFRRSGTIFYRPRCPSCDACQPLRVPVDAFAPSRSQRRVLRRNADLLVRVGRPHLTAAKERLYQRYREYQHPGSPQTADPQGLDEFLYQSVVDSLEATYAAPDGRLIGVSILDITDRAVSSVYHYFDPDEAHRSLGVFSILHEIDLTRRWDRPHYYLGYWITGCATMDYKARYRPHELLIDGKWVRRD